MTPAVRRSDRVDGDTDSLRMGVSRALNWLCSRQHADGRFVALRTDLDDFGAVHQVRCDATPFVTARVILSLDGLDCASTRLIRQRAIPYLTGQPGPEGECRFWERGHLMQRSIPADVDDTACIYAALHSCGARPRDCSRLIRWNKSASGLLYTWITPRWPPPRSWRALRALVSDLSVSRLWHFWRQSEACRNDIDAVVNAHVVASLVPGISSSAVIGYLVDRARAETEDSGDKWYHGRGVFYYALARALRAGHRTLESLSACTRHRLAELARDDGQLGEDALETAQAVVALTEFGHAEDPLTRRAIRYLLACQRRDGGWDHAPYFWGGPLRRVHWGSRELTTAVCIEALSSYYYQRQATDSRFSPSLLPPVLALET